MSSDDQRPSRRPPWNKLVYAFHESGHALVGHVLGRCIEEISIDLEKTSHVKGYCAFDLGREDAHGLEDWHADLSGFWEQSPPPRPEILTMTYAGMCALQLACEEYGKDPFQWNIGGENDLERLRQACARMTADVQEQQALEHEALDQAIAILLEYWPVLDAFATALASEKTLYGWEAHRLLFDLFGHEPDWRALEPAEDPQWTATEWYKLLNPSESTGASKD